MRSVSIDVDVDLDDIVRSIWRKDDKLDLLELLLDELEAKDVLKAIKSHENYRDMTNQIRTALVGDDTSFTYACNKISANRWRMNLEDEQYILNLADKL